MTPLLLALRPKQWVKNLLIFAAVLFSLHFRDTHLLLRVLIGFVAYCATSSAVYVMNDVIDLQSDRQHPVKSLRPIASGQVSPNTAIGVAVVLLIAALGTAWWLEHTFFFLLLGYLVLQLVYSTTLKHMVFLDVMAIATGFVLRAIGGAFIIHVEFSHWLIICTFLLALFLGFGKRRHELTLMTDDAHMHRRVLGDYSPYLLDQMIGVVTASTLIVYILYTTSAEVQQHFGTINLIYTVPFVLYGIFRYLLLIHQKDRGGDPTKTLLDDHPLQVAIVAWVAAVLLILYPSLR